MRVLFVIGKLQFSGAENVLRAIAPLIKQDGYDVYIALRYKCDEREYQGIQLFDYSGSIYQRNRKLSRIINSNRIDVVVSFGFPYNLDCSLVKLTAKCKVILCERHDPVSVSRTKKQRIEKQLLYPLADGYIVQTHRTAEYYLEHYTHNPKCVFVIPNPVRYCKPTCVSNMERRKEIVAVGRYDNRQKNHLMLMNAFLIVHEKQPEYILKLYGDGEDRQLYEKTIKEAGAQDYIILMGYEKELIKKIATGDIFVLSSNNEGMPNALIEAMSLGLPCISTDCGGGAAAELINDHENGLLVPVNDVNKMAEAILFLIEHPDVKVKLAKEAYKINDRFNLKAISRMWEASIDSITN